MRFAGVLLMASAFALGSCGATSNPTSSSDAGTD